MSRLPISPRPLSQDDFNKYSQNWKSLIAKAKDNPDALATLKKCFTSSNGLAINYAYLNTDIITPMLADITDGDFIKVKFVLVGDTLADSVFSLALYHTRADGSYVPKAEAPHYYLAGVPATPAPLGFAYHEPDALAAAPTPPSGYVPTATAEAWIKKWNEEAPKNLTAALFDARSTEKAPEPDTYLQGYTFMITDFTTPWPPYRTMYDALWLNFDLKPQDPEILNGPLIFSTIVDYNTTPNNPDAGVLVLQRQMGADAFYDISKPCPPYTC